MHATPTVTHTPRTQSKSAPSTPLLSCTPPPKQLASLSALALGRCAKDVVFFRQFASDIGFPQPLPTIILEDNQPAINLTTSNQVTRKSRHIALKSHYVRWLYLTKQIAPLHISTHDMIADGLTKSLSPSKFLWFRSQLLNTPAIQQ